MTNQDEVLLKSSRLMDGEEVREKLEHNPARPVFLTADLAASIQLVNQMWRCSGHSSMRLANLTQAMTKLLRAENACVYESRGRSPGVMTELHRHEWRDWQSDELSKNLSGRKLLWVSQSCIHMIWQPRLNEARANGSWHCIASCLPAGIDYYMTLAFARRAQPFSEREASLLRTIHASPAFELVSQRRTRLNASDLSARMREVLSSLLRGNSEKQIAKGLELSRHTIHAYVKAIYRRYNVNTRAELLSQSIDPAAMLAMHL